MGVQVIKFFQKLMHYNSIWSEYVTSNVLLDNSISTLYKWVRSEKYYGWVPYDALNSKLVPRKFNYGT
jgi:hypothetical protein